MFLNSCLIRQDKNSVSQWVKRMALVRNNLDSLEETFEMALGQIDVFKTNQGLVELFIAYANEFFLKKKFKRLGLLYLIIGFVINLKHKIANKIGVNKNHYSVSREYDLVFKLN